MKRKKLNIDIMNSSLKRSELREITAGCGSGGGTGGGGSPHAECEYIYNQCMAGNSEVPFTFEWHNYNNNCMHLYNCCERQAGSSIHPC